MILPRQSARRSLSAVLAATVAVLLAVTVSDALGGPAVSTPHTATTSPAGAAPERAATAPRAVDRPNLVLVMADDMRQDDLRFMPELRRLVTSQGTQFANSFSPYPLCCPARASLLTGQLAHNHKVLSHLQPYGFSAFDDSYTLATALQESGYRTAFVGKYLNGYGPHRSRVSGGPSWRYVPRGWDDWRAAVEKGGGGPATGDTYNYFHTSYNLNGRVWNDPGSYQTNTLGSMARDVVGRYSGQASPFFLYLSFVAPHFTGAKEPDDPARLATPSRPQWVKGRFDGSVRRAPGLDRRGHADPHMEDEPGIMRNAEAEPGPAMRAAMLESTRQRAEAIYVMDRQIGRLVAELKSRGEWDDTILMFTSDNGYFLGEHRRPEGKMLPHEPSLRVPFLLTGPGVPQGVRRYDPITTVDLTATIADYAGALDRLGSRLTQDGRSMVSVVREGDRGWRTGIGTEMLNRKGGWSRGGGFGPRDAIGVRVGSWKFIRYARGGEALYHLDRDPNELRNLAERAKYRPVRRALLRVWRQLKDCRGAGCQVPLPERFQLTAAEERQRTIAQLAGVRRRTGVPQL